MIKRCGEIWEKEIKEKWSEAIVSDLDELLKIPKEPCEEEKTRNTILDEGDKRIAKAERAHEAQMW